MLDFLVRVSRRAGWVGNTSTKTLARHSKAYATTVAESVEKRTANAVHPPASNQDSAVQAQKANTAGYHGPPDDQQPEAITVAAPDRSRNNGHVPASGAHDVRRTGLGVPLAESAPPTGGLNPAKVHQKADL